MLNLPLTKNVAEKLRQYTNKKDQIQIASQFGLKFCSLQDILYRDRLVRAKHIPAIKELAKRAISTAQDAHNDIQLLKNI